MSGKLRLRCGLIYTVMSCCTVLAASPRQRNNFANCSIDQSGDFRLDSKPKNAFVAAPCLALSAALFFLGTGLAPLWQLSWLAPIPVLWVTSRLSPRQAFIVAAAVYALGSLNEWSYLRMVLSTWIVGSFLVLSACLFAVGQSFRIHKPLGVCSNLLMQVGPQGQRAIVVKPLVTSPAYWIANSLNLNFDF
jgi:hypothetical protein